MAGGRKSGRKNRAGWAFLLPQLVGVLLFYGIPMGQVLVRSFRSPLGDQWVGLENYETVVHNAAFQTAFHNTVRFTLVCIPALILLGLGVAMALYRMKRVGGALRSAFLMPMAVPAASVVLVWKGLFFDRGLINGWLQALGLTGIGWMDTGAAFWMLVLSYLWKNLGYTVVLWTAGLAAIPESLYEAAKVDGADGWQCFRWITLPSLKGTGATIAVLSLLNSFRVFREAWLVAGDYPHQSMYLVQHLYNNWFRELSYEKIAAGSVMTSAVVFLLAALLDVL